MTFVYANESSELCQKIGVKYFKFNHRGPNYRAPFVNQLSTILRKTTSGIDIGSFWLRIAIQILFLLLSITCGPL